jgi:acyl-CoA thioester hydrolase
MNEYNFYYPIQVRFGDLDPFGHVNNARFLSYLESTRMAYFQHLNLWGGKSFLSLEMIVADVHISFINPVFLGQNIKVGQRVGRIGNKSMEFVYQIEDSDTGSVMAKATCVMVAYNYETLKSIPVKDDWRKTISQFEKLAD